MFRTAFHRSVIRRIAGRRTRPGTDLLVAAVLLLALAVALLVAALAPPVPLVVSLDEPQAGVQLQGFYSSERNARGIFRWTEPVAAIAIDASAFADHRLTLTLQGVPNAASHRPLAVLLGDEAVASVPVGAEPRRYSFLLPRPSVPRSLARTTWSIRLEAPASMPSGDGRALGVLVAGVESTPVRSWRPPLPPLLLPLVVVLAVYAALRVLRLPPLAAAAILLLPVAWFGTVAARSPLDALQLAHLPLAYPWYTASGLGLLAAVGVLASLGRRQVIRALPLLPVLVPVLQIVLLIQAIWTQTAAVPFWDEWETVDLLYEAEQGTLGWTHFWAFHNEHRLVLPRLISLGLIELTHWNRQWAMTFDLGLALAAGAALLWCVRRTLGSWRWSLALAPLLALSFFSFTQYENWLWPFQITFVLTVVGASACMLALARERVTHARFAFALLGALVSSLSSLAGLMVWPAFFPVAARLGRRYALLWIGAALLVGIPYFAGFPSRASTDTPLLDIVRYGLAYLGAPPGAYNASTAQIFAAGSLLVIALNLFAAWRVGVDLRPVAPWSGLGLFALACAAITALGRGPALGVRQALSSRYHAFSGLWWVVVLVSTAFVTLHMWRTSGAARPGRESTLRRLVLSVNALALSLVCLGLVQANRTGYSDLQHWQRVPRQQQECVLQYLTAPESCLTLFYPDPQLLRIRAAYLDRRGMAIWRARREPPVARQRHSDPETRLRIEQHYP